MYFDRDNKPIEFEEWRELMGVPAYCQLAHDSFGSVRVSTVWIGVDSGLGRIEPRIFETMIFGGAHHLDQWRYATEAEARAGHAEAVALVIPEVREGLN